ncbi:hypothetical protein DRE_00753 [Drechslerella stenobrocha 248]|uniref:RNA exonuclease 4 n=1 Tax=Drechslerella stenobrocha 248 TaxID=1043628 RepID=W7HQB7_9PEZI|nr:hypothetical protein DRE_00753 [Drechslerella stenobrocha 248]
MSRPPPLSSNWKALQLSLKRKDPADHTTSDDRQPSPPKRRKPTPPDAASTMQVLSSQQADGGATTSRTKLVLRTTIAAKAQRQSSVSEKSTPPTVAPALASPAPGTDKASEAGRYIAIDCEMVGVGPPGSEMSALARVSLVNYNGHCVLDTFVKPKERVTDWRTWVSGVSPKDMVNAITLEEAQQRVHAIIDGKILVGHAIHNDLDALFLSHPKRDIRDTARHPAFRKLAKQKNPGLKRLAKEVLGIDIQGSAHSSVEDARVTMMLYRKERKEFERLVTERYGVVQRGKQKQMPRGNKKKKKKKKSAEGGGANGKNGEGGDSSGEGGDNDGEEEGQAEGEDFDDWLA